MINVESYVNDIIDNLKGRFGCRLLYVGLQGSYLRGEATDSSDIDVMVIVNKLCVDDLDEYRAVIEAMDHFDRSCGFICSDEDLKNWNPLEICHLSHTTKDYYGNLSDYIPPYSKTDVVNFVKMSINNTYHAICHCRIHRDAAANRENLVFAYKGIFFILQNLYYLKYGKFIVTKKEMLENAKGIDREVMECAFELSGGENNGFDESFQLLFKWCQETIKEVGNINFSA